jgi:hypothetical protein
VGRPQPELTTMNAAETRTSKAAGPTYTARRPGKRYGTASSGSGEILIPDVPRSAETTPSPQPAAKMAVPGVHSSRFPERRPATPAAAPAGRRQFSLGLPTPPERAAEHWAARDHPGPPTPALLRKGGGRRFCLLPTRAEGRELRPLSTGGRRRFCALPTWAEGRDLCPLSTGGGKRFVPSPLAGEG